MSSESQDPQVEREATSPTLPVLVMGVGNILLRDDGLGVHVIREMERLELPEHVELLDGGTAGLDLLYQVANRDRLIIVDAAKGGAEPGTIYRFNPDDVPMMQRECITSIHQVSLFETLTVAKYLGCAPREVIVLGVEPMDISWGLELSPEVAKVVPKVAELALSCAESV